MWGKLIAINSDIHPNVSLSKSEIWFGRGKVKKTREKRTERKRTKERVERVERDERERIYSLLLSYSLILPLRNVC